MCNRVGRANAATRPFFAPRSLALCPPVRAQVRLFALAGFRLLQRKLAWVTRQADLDGDGELTMDDSQIAYSRIAPLVRRHTALTGGLVGGFVTAYSALR